MITPIPLESTVASVRGWLGTRKPVAAIVLGSGLGQLADALDDPIRLRYADIPGFPDPSVAGHEGELVAGSLSGRDVLCQSGRFHGYEGLGPGTAALPVRVFGVLGVGFLLLTNAAGGIRRSLRTGSLMLITDHINLTFRSPLFGPTLPGEIRFPDMSDPYDGELRAWARAVARDLGIAMEEGVYAGVQGPSYETPAEIRFLEGAGADAVGMSTIAEVVAARARGIRCAGISIIANQAAGIIPVRLSHADVIRAASGAAEMLGRLLTGIVGRLPG